MSVSGAAAGSQIRRHHTISITPNRATGSSRTGVISEEPQEGQEGSDWHEDDDDFVAEDWTAPAIGSVGDGSKGLHRQASLPTAYHNRGANRRLLAILLSKLTRFISLQRFIECAQLPTWQPA